MARKIIGRSAEMLDLNDLMSFLFSDILYLIVNPESY
jgi:hypothetical protein